MCLLSRLAKVMEIYKMYHFKMTVTTNKFMHSMQNLDDKKWMEGLFNNPIREDD